MSNQANKNSYRNKLKKRRKKFAANVKGFGKLGNYGRGSHIEQDEWNYFINIMTSIKAGFESLDDKLTMADNVLEQTIDKETHISSNQVASTIVETLLPFSNAENFERFQQKFAENFRPLCSDKFASHILEKIISISMLRAIGHKKGNTNDEKTVDEPKAKKRRINKLPSEREYNVHTEFSDEHRQKCNEFVLKASKFLLNNLEDFVWDTYGSPVMRTCLFSLSGIFQTKTNFITNDTEEKYEIGTPRYDAPDEWIEIIKEYANRLQAWPQFKDFPYNDLTSILFQYILIALHHRDKNLLKHIGKRLINESFTPTIESQSPNTIGESTDVKPNVSDGEDNSTGNDAKEDKQVEKNESKAEDAEQLDKSLPSVFGDYISVRCLETLIKVSGAKLFVSIYTQLFRGHLVKLSTFSISSISVQKLLQRVPDKETFELIYDELDDSIEDILRSGYSGVINDLAAACLRLGAKQGPFMKSIQTTLDCLQPKEKSDRFAMLTLKLKPYSVAKDDTSKSIDIHGALLLQTMLKFNKPIKLVQSLLDTPNSELIEIFNSPQGSHVADAFMESQYVGEKSREKLIRHMDGFYIDLAMSKHGSWVLEKLYNASAYAQKARIVKQLAEKENQLNGSPFGRIISSNFNVSTYRLSPDQWKAALNKEAKVEKIFEDILK